jgi:cation transport regulator ChaB
MAKKQHKPLKKHQYSKPVQDQISDIDYWDKLNTKDKKWLEQFMDEYAGNNHQKYSNKKRLLKDETHQKEARRLNNSFNRDAYDVAKKTVKLDYSENDDKVFYSKENITDWMEAYTVQGHKEALDMILEDSLLELKETEDQNKQRLAMVRFFIRMRRYFTQVNKEKKNEHT